MRLVPEQNSGEWGCARSFISRPAETKTNRRRTEVVTNLRQNGTIVLKSWQFSSTGDALLSKLCAGFRPRVVESVTDVFELNPGIFQENPGQVINSKKNLAPPR